MLKNESNLVRVVSLSKSKPKLSDDIVKVSLQAIVTAGSGQTATDAQKQAAADASKKIAALTLSFKLTDDFATLPSPMPTKVPIAALLMTMTLRKGMDCKVIKKGDCMRLTKPIFLTCFASQPISVMVMVIHRVLFMAGHSNIASTDVRCSLWIHPLTGVPTKKQQLPRPKPVYLR